MAAAAVAPAQDGSLAGVTMRVLDDVSGIDAVFVAIDTGRGEARSAEQPTADDGGARTPERADSADRERDDTDNEARDEAGREDGDAVREPNAAP